MASRKVIEAEIGSLAGLGGIVSTYKEIAAGRITRTRTSVLKGHKFLNEINEIYQQVKSSYKNEVAALMKQKKVKDPRKLSFVKRNNKTIYILVSANTGLYGDLVRRTFEAFEDVASKAKQEGNDVAVIGRLGFFMMVEAGLPTPAKYFDLADQTIEEEKLREIALFLIEYEKVIVYYEEFKSIVKQDPAISDISGNPLAQQPQDTRVVKYLFEPSLEKVLEFFEKEIFSAIFEQTIKDSQLAKFGARLVTLDNASENIRKRLNYAIFEATRQRHREKNKKQNQTFASMSLWKR